MRYNAHCLTASIQPHKSTIITPSNQYKYLIILYKYSLFVVGYSRIIVHVIDTLLTIFQDK